MSGFNATRFAEAFAAALLGAYIHEGVKSNMVGQTSNRDAAQKFQRCLLLAASNDGFTEVISVKYRQRIGLLKERARMKYIKMTLQPNQPNCDERLTSLLIFDHALQSNVEWEATVRMLSLDSPSSADNILNGVSDLAKDMDDAMARHAEDRREKDSNLGWFDRMLNKLLLF